MDAECTYMRIQLNSGEAHCYLVPIEPAPLLVIAARRGFVMCGYLDIEVVEDMGAAAAKVWGVSSFNDVLNARIVEATSRAREMGVSIGMRGKDALERMC